MKKIIAVCLHFIFSVVLPATDPISDEAPPRWAQKTQLSEIVEKQMDEMSLTKSDKSAIRKIVDYYRSNREWFRPPGARGSGVSLEAHVSYEIRRDKTVRFPVHAVRISQLPLDDGDRIMRALMAELYRACQHDAARQMRFTYKASEEELKRQVEALCAEHNVLVEGAVSRRGRSRTASSASEAEAKEAHA